MRLRATQVRHFPQIKGQTLERESGSGCTSDRPLLRSVPLRSAPRPGHRTPVTGHHAADGRTICAARRAGGGLLRPGHGGAGVPGVGARADPLRPLHSGEAEPVSGGGARMRRGVAGARLRMLPRLRPAGRRAVRDLHGAVRLRTEVHPQTRRPAAAAFTHPGAGRVRGERRAGVDPRAPNARSGRAGRGDGERGRRLGPRLRPLPPRPQQAVRPASRRRRAGEHESQAGHHPQEAGGAGALSHRAADSPGQDCQIPAEVRRQTDQVLPPQL